MFISQAYYCNQVQKDKLSNTYGNRKSLLKSVMDNMFKKTSSESKFQKFKTA